MLELTLKGFREVENTLKDVNMISDRIAWTRCSYKIHIGYIVICERETYEKKRTTPYLESKSLLPSRFRSEIV